MKLAMLVTGSYLALAGLSIAYELSIRLYDRGNSELAGMLSTRKGLVARACSSRYLQLWRVAA